MCVLRQTGGFQLPIGGGGGGGGGAWGGGGAEPYWKLSPLIKLLYSKPNAPALNYPPGWWGGVVHAYKLAKCVSPKKIKNKNIMQ